MAEVEQPIIIKKITIEEGGAHGGAWKVAYADFVTAMMAFFLLLWLLSSASEEQKEGLAEYFTPTVGIQGEKGIGFEGGLTLTEDGTLKDTRTPVAIVSGRQHQGPIPEAPTKKALIEGTAEDKLFEKAEEFIKNAFESDPTLRDLSDNIIVEQNPEGLKLDILDSDKKSMFVKGTQISVFGKEILNKLAELIQKMPNHISITGHTDAQPFNSEKGNANWDLSTGRANSARRYLMTRRLKDERIGKIMGLADRELIVPDVPDSPRNRRITIILLRGSHMFIPLELRAAPRSLLSVPRVDRLNTDAGLAKPSSKKDASAGQKVIQTDGSEVSEEEADAPASLEDEGF